MLFLTGALGSGIAGIRVGFRRLIGIGVVLAGSASVAACGSSSSNPQSTDKTAPVIQSVYSTLNGKAFDVSIADAQRVINAASSLEFDVQAKDDVTPIEKLKAQALDVDDKPIASQNASYDQGLWKVTTTAMPGLTIRLAVSDEEGNQTIWPYAAIFPTQAQALVRQWTLLVYDPATTTVVSRPHLTMTATTWCQDDDAVGDGPSGGTWSVLSDGRLKMETRGHAPCTGNVGNDGNTVLSSRTAPFCVVVDTGATYFSDGPYKNQNGPVASGADLVGTWTRTADIATTGPAQTVTSSLTLAADQTFQETTEDGHQVSGTYQQEQNTDYTSQIGNLLVLTTTHEDGASVAPQKTVHYWAIENGELLLDPFVELP